MNKFINKQNIVVHIVIPFIIAVSTLFLYLMNTIGFEQITIPKEYMNETPTSYPLLEIKEYWKQKAILTSMYVFVGSMILTLIPYIFIFIKSQLIKKKIK